MPTNSANLYGGGVYARACVWARVCACLRDVFAIILQTHHARAHTLSARFKYYYHILGHTKLIMDFSGQFFGGEGGIKIKLTECAKYAESE